MAGHREGPLRRGTGPTETVVAAQCRLGADQAKVIATARAGREDGPMRPSDLIVRAGDRVRAAGQIIVDGDGRWLTTSGATPLVWPPDLAAYAESLPDGLLNLPPSLAPLRAP